jgi:quercetin dioxygenase-like cupin family protein
MPNQIANAAGKPIIRAAGTGPVHDVLDVTHTYKALATETGGLVSVWETAVPPGGGAPHHSHAGEDEAFYVLEGELTLQVGEEVTTAAAGSLAFAPRGVHHTVANTADAPARYLLVCTPGGFERMFSRLAARASGVEPDAEALKPYPETVMVGPTLFERLGRAS